MKENPEKRNHWQQHVDALKSSGLTRREYCEKNQVSPSTLDYWCRKLNSDPGKMKKKNVTAWIPLQIGDGGHASTIDLQIGRITIAVRSGFDPTLLKELLRTLGALC